MANKWRSNGACLDFLWRVQLNVDTLGGRILMVTVFVVQHIHEDAGIEEAKLIGVYSSEESARLAIERLVGQPGFIDRPEGFHVDTYRVDEDHWSEGFISVANIDVPRRCEARRFEEGSEQLVAVEREARRAPTRVLSCAADWKLFTDAHTTKNAARLGARAIKLLGLDYAEPTVTPYHKGGFTAAFSSQHSGSWAEIVLEILAAAQRLGSGWTLSGSIVNELDLITSSVRLAGVELVHIAVRRSVVE